MGALFPTLAVSNSLKADEAELLRILPSYPTVEELGDNCHAVARRLEAKRLIKIHRERNDPVAARATWYAGALPAALKWGA